MAHNPILVERLIVRLEKSGVIPDGGIVPSDEDIAIAEKDHPNASEAEKRNWAIGEAIIKLAQKHNILVD